MEKYKEHGLQKQEENNNNLGLIHGSVSAQLFVLE